MPQTVEIPDQGIVEFPDDMTPDQIKGVIQKKFYASPTPSVTPQAGEIAPPVIADSGYVGRGEFAPTAGAESAPLTSRESPQEQAAQQSPLANAAAVATELAQGAPQMALGVAKAGYEGLKLASGAGGPQEQTRILANTVVEGLQQGRQIAQDVQSPLGSKESFRGLANVGMMAVPALQELLFAKPTGLAKPPVQSQPSTLNETLFGKEPDPLTAAVNEGLTESESKYAPPDLDKVEPVAPQEVLGKQEPVAPNLPTGTVEVVPEGRITAAAVRDAEGNVFTGRTHPEAADAALQAGARLPKTKIEGTLQNDDGFVTDKGEFLTQPEAYQRALSFKQIKPQDFPVLEAESFQKQQPSPVSESPVSTTGSGIPEDATAKVQFKTSDGGQVTREMNAREAEGIFTKEKSSYKALIDCLGR